MLLKRTMFSNKKAALFLALALCLGTTGCSTILEAQENYIVVEKGAETGVPTIVEWNNKQYTLDFSGWIEMMESSDNGETWQRFISDYDTMKPLFSTLGIELYTYEEFLELIAYYKETIPSTDESWLETMAWYDGLAEQWKNEGTAETFYPMMKGLRFSYEVDIPGSGKEEHFPPSSYYLPQLYNRLLMSLEYDRDNGYLTQEEADAIVQRFMSEYQLPR